MNSTAELDQMRIIVLCAGFRGDAFHSVVAALLMIGLRKHTFSAAECPRELTNGDKHISGLATKALIKMGLVYKCGYIPSPNADAKGRPVLALTIPSDKIATARTYLARHGYQDSATSQTELALK